MSLQEKHLYEFGPYRLDAHEHVLLRDGEVVPLAPKAIDLLTALVENSGHVLGKDELMKQVWPDTIVEEANLSHHVFSLRKALEEDRNGNRYIETIPRRGYRFVASVTELQDELLVKEHIRSQIIIEEMIESGDAPGREVGAPEPARLNGATPQPRALMQASQAGPLKRRLAMPTLLVVGLLAAGGAMILPWRMFFSGRQAATPAWKMKITRLTGTGKSGATISSDGRFISYWQNYTEGAGTIWVRQNATNKEIQLIEPAERVFDGSAFSSDGQFIYYAASDKYDPQGALYRVPVLGGPPARLLGNFGSKFTFSPDGLQATFYRYSPGQQQRSMLIAALDGSSEQVLLTFKRPEKIFSGNPAWSPDGKRIAFAATAEPERNAPSADMSLFTLDLASRQIRSLTSERWREIGKLSWSHDGQTLFFVGARPRIGNQLYYLNYPQGEVHRFTPDLQSYGNYGLGITTDGSTLVADLYETTAQLWAVDADGQASSANRLTTGTADGSSGLSSLPDGRIAYVSRTGDDYDLWTINGDGTEGKSLTGDAFFEGSVTATADGHSLVFASNRAGGSHLFRMDAAGSNLKQLTYGEGSDTTPDCSPDGKWVVYASGSGDKTTIWKVPLDGGPPVQLTDYHSIAPSFSPDGNFISCILPSESKVEKGSLIIIPADGGPPITSFQVMPFAHYYVTPRWTPDGQAVVYAERQNNAGNLWRQPLTGGAPQPLTDFKTELIFNFAFSRDGKRIVLARGRKDSSIVLISDFK